MVALFLVPLFFSGRELVGFPLLFQKAPLGIFFLTTSVC